MSDTDKSISFEDFIAESLTDICNGIARAARQVADTGAEINPVVAGLYEHLAQAKILVSEETGESVAIVEFDAAVTATKSTNRKAGIGVLFAALGAGIDEQNQKQNESISRIKFSVPVKLPSKLN